MKFAAVIEYANDKEKIDAVHPAHRQYLRTLLEKGQLCAAGPLAEDRGALIVYDAASQEDAAAMVKGDPYFVEGVIAKWQLHPMKYWSAKECVGAK